MVKKFKNLCFSSDKWQLAEKNFDKFRKTLEIELFKIFWIWVIFKEFIDPIQKE